jgi:hypothetical protein
MLKKVLHACFQKKISVSKTLLTIIKANFDQKAKRHPQKAAFDHGNIFRRPSMTPYLGRFCQE